MTQETTTFNEFEYFQHLKSEYKKAVQTAREYRTQVYFDAIESMHLEELSLKFNEDGFATANEIESIDKLQTK